MTDELKAAVEEAWHSACEEAVLTNGSAVAIFIRALADEPEAIEELWHTSGTPWWAPKDEIKVLLKALAEIVK